MKRLPFPKSWFFLSVLPFCMAVMLCSCRTNAPATNTATTEPATQLEASPGASVPCQSGQLLPVAGRMISNLGNAGVQLSFQNRSQASCTLSGYPMLQLLNAQQKPVQATILQSTTGYLYSTRPAQMITLHPGKFAYFAVTWDNQGCGKLPPASYASPVSFLRVTPPRNQLSQLIAARFCAFRNAVSVSPLEPSQILGVFL